MTSTDTTRRHTPITVAPLEEVDLPEADAVFRLAFGTMLGLPDPARFAEGTQMIRSRWLADPSGAFKAVVEGEIVGSAFTTRWGSYAGFGPLTVRPDFWDKGVGSRLWEARLPLLELWGITDASLFTSSESTKHVHLYQKFGFWPRFLTALTDKMLTSSLSLDASDPAETLSSLAASMQDQALRECGALADAIYPGLDLTREIRAVTDRRIGDVVLLREAGSIAGFAVCHAGTGSETGPGTCYIKFAAARPGAAAHRFGLLLDRCENYARSRDLARLEVGINLACHDAYRLLTARGHRTYRQGVAMHWRNQPGLSRPDSFVLHDGR